MKKILSIIMIISMVLSLASCGGTKLETLQETAEQKQENLPPSTTLKIAESGSSRYTILHDGTAEGEKLATEIRNLLKAKFGAEVGMTDDAKSVDRYRIMIGGAGEEGKKAVESFTSPFDFSVKVQEDTLLLAAPNEISYYYLLTYLKKEVLVRKNGNDLTLTPEDSITYSTSSLSETDFIEYLNASGSTPGFKDYFAAGTFKHGDTELLYRIYVPFDATEGKEYPIFVNLHGAGIRGSDNERPLSFVKKPFGMEEINMKECIVIVPQCPENEKWVDIVWKDCSYDLTEVGESNELAAVVALVEHVIETYPVDESRIYAAGFSMGGYGTWNLLMNHPDLFTAGVAMCGAGDPTEAEKLLNTPVWAIHGALDETVPVRGSREMVQAIQDAGGELCRYTELPENEHDVWTYTYSSTEIFTWLFSQKKG